jgi:hypothetical protein
MILKGKMSRFKSLKRINSVQSHCYKLNNIDFWFDSSKLTNFKGQRPREAKKLEPEALIPSWKYFASWTSYEPDEFILVMWRLLGLPFNPEDENSTFPRNVVELTELRGTKSQKRLFFK